SSILLISFPFSSGNHATPSHTDKTNREKRHMDWNETKALLTKIFDAAVAAAHPASCLVRELPPPPARGNVIVLAAGKAAGSMAEVTERHYLGAGLPADRLSGLAVSRHG